VRGPTGCRYLADERQRDYVRNGWNLTGDSFVQDEDGRFHFAARTDDMIVSAGYNIAGPEVEAALLAHPDVIECAVIGVPDEARGQIVEAHVVLAEGVEPNEETRKRLQEHAKQAIAPYNYPRSLKFVSALPKTQTGKIQRFRLREEAKACPTSRRRRSTARRQISLPACPMATTWNSPRCWTRSIRCRPPTTRCCSSSSTRPRSCGGSSPSTRSRPRCSRFAVTTCGRPSRG